MMRWYYTKGPSHTRVRVFMNGANCGDLCFRNEEFYQIQTSNNFRELIEFKKDPPEHSQYANVEPHEV